MAKSTVESLSARIETATTKLAEVTAACKETITTKGDRIAKANERHANLVATKAHPEDVRIAALAVVIAQARLNRQLARNRIRLNAANMAVKAAQTALDALVAANKAKAARKALNAEKQAQRAAKAQARKEAAIKGVLTDEDGDNHNLDATQAQKVKDVVGRVKSGTLSLEQSVTLTEVIGHWGDIFTISLKGRTTFIKFVVGASEGVGMSFSVGSDTPAVTRKLAVAAV